MKIYPFIVLLIFYSLATNAQVLDSFSDGDFSNNPTWTPDAAANWAIVNNQLRSNSATPNSTFFISTPSAQALNSQWEFYVNLQFNTSSANYVDVYLTSSNATMTGASGYFVRIGGTPDEVSLYKSNAGAATILINGRDGITNNSNTILKIKITRDAANVWTLSSDVTATGNNYVSEGTITDNSFTTSSFFGIRITQSTASFFSKHFFDDFYAGPITLDTAPPILNSITVASSTELTLLFNESLEASSAQTISNYVANNGIGNPTTAVLQPDKKTVKLTFTNPFGNGTQNQLAVAAVKDLAGNAMTLATLPFLYFLPVAEKKFDIVVSEIFPDPDPIIGLPAAEFIEIYNRSSNAFDLSGWKLTDGTSTATFASQIILPNQYWIVTSSTNTALFAAYQNVIGVAGFPSLNNSGDMVLLKSSAGLTIDSLNYSLGWYRDADKQQGGWSLEKIDLNKTSTDALNWVASQDATGGTPGRQNSWFGKNPDVAPPKLVSLTVKNDSQLELLFDETLDASSVVVSNFSVTNGIANPSSVLLLSDQKTISLSFTTKFQNGTENALSIIAVADLVGNKNSALTQTFTYIIYSASANKDVIINEIFADPTPSLGLPEAEYIELYNRSAHPFDMAGWSFQAGNSKTIFTTQILLPKQYLIVTNAKNTNTFSRYGKVLGLVSFPVLPNDGASLLIKNDKGQVIDSLNYSPAWYRSSDKAEGGYALELIDPNNPCGEEDNWTASESTMGGTPGKQNSVVANKPDLVGPVFVSIEPITDAQLLFTFNEKLDKAPLQKENFLFTPPVLISSIRFVDVSKRQLVATLASPIEKRKLYSVALLKVYDCAGNVMQDAFSQLTFALPEEVEANDVLINEILFNPKPTGVDFVEVYNNSQKYISLNGLKFANIENGTVKNLEPISAGAPILEPRQFKAFTTEPAVLKNNYPFGEERNFIKTVLPSLPDDEGSIALIGKLGTVIDSFLYASKLHSPLIRDDEGVSLERISYQANANDAVNWRSASSQSGYATPGYINSNSRPEQNLLDGKVKVEPEVFAPNSGVQDFAKINYAFDQNNFTATIKIIDQQGRLVKTIANNETLGYSGFFRWDGNLEDGTKARMGYYTVWIELFDETGVVNTLRKRVVVASR